MSACSLPHSPSLAAFPTPSFLIQAGEITSTRAESQPTPGQFETRSASNSQDCLEKNFDPQMSSSPCLVGTADTTYDVTIQQTASETDHVIAPLHVDFELWAIAAGQLAGKASLTYSLHATITDPASRNCQFQEAAVDQFGWTVNLRGQYFTLPDGTVQVLLQASPLQGPAYTEKVSACGAPDQEQPGVTWPGTSGKLSNGAFDATLTNPLPANATGTFTTVTHMDTFH